MSGYQDFVKAFGKGIFITSKAIAERYPLQKALASLYILPTFFRGIYYIPTERERKGHFIEKRQDFFTSLFDFKYGRRRWYWALSTAARHHGVEWSATNILEVVALGRPKTIDLSDKIRSLGNKRSYRSRTLAKYLASLNVTILYLHKGMPESLSSIKIDDAMGPVCTKQQLLEDIGRFLPKTRDRRIKNIYKRIIANLKHQD
ncbi:hypothetical protein H0O00_01990 [Candidatus Micrarchaeota archaeon]|nr:hypothetical protein [Candidatus Micrarchaeota archaeon]